MTVLIRMKVMINMLTIMMLMDDINDKDDGR